MPKYERLRVWGFARDYDEGGLIEQISQYF
jgi:hypothetical protein